MKNVLPVVAAGIIIGAAAGAALAGGINQEDLDPLALLHDDHAFAVELSGFMRQSTNGRTGARNGYGWNGVSTSGADPSGKSGSLAVKTRVARDGDCMLKLHQPWARWERRDPKWAAANEFAESRLESLLLDAACSWRFDMEGTAQLRVTGGLRAGGLEVYHQLGLPAHLAFHLKSHDVGLSWRAGLSWEDPADGLRISALYTAPMGFSVTGQQWYNGVPTGAELRADIEMPQTLSLRVERDIAPDWRGAFDAQWTEWSAFDGLAISGVTLSDGNLGEATFPTGFTNAVTLKAEVEHDLTEDWRLAGSLRWDQGVSGGIADLWTVGAKVGRRLGAHADIEFGAALGWRMEGAASGLDSVTGRSWSYTSEAGPVYGVQARIKFTF
jgi:long-chain fatty acid transport protein